MYERPQCSLIRTAAHCALQHSASLPAWCGTPWESKADWSQYEYGVNWVEYEFWPGYWVMLRCKVWWCAVINSMLFTTAVRDVRLLVFKAEWCRGLVTYDRFMCGWLVALWIDVKCCMQCWLAVSGCALLVVILVYVPTWLQEAPGWAAQTGPSANAMTLVRGDD